VAASVDEEIQHQDRLSIIRHFPTYEVDDQTNEFGGSIERLGVNGEMLTCPGFPTGGRSGPETSIEAWIDELREAGYLSPRQFAVMQHLVESCLRGSSFHDTTAYCDKLTQAIEHAVWEEWSSLRQLLDSIDRDRQQQGNGTRNG
jgi:hypothetical protein